MSGNRYLLDTNAIVALLQGNTQLIQLLQNPDWIGISVISQIEFLAFPGLGQDDTGKPTREAIANCFNSFFSE